MIYTLDQIADLLESAQRYGYAPDHRAPAGGFDTPAPRRPHLSTVAVNGLQAPSDRFVRLSDALARDIAQSLRHLARQGAPGQVPLETRGTP